MKEREKKISKESESLPCIAIASCEVYQIWRSLPDLEEDEISKFGVDYLQKMYQSKAKWVKF